MSNLGNVAPAVGRRGSVPLKPLSQNAFSSGYRKVTLRKDGRSSNVMIHRAVALAFIPNPENKTEVNHIDGDKLNNRVDNLEWCTKSENAIHASRVLGKKGHGVEHSVKITAEDAREIYLSDMPVSRIASEYGISDTMVRRIKNRKSWRMATCQLTE